MLSSPPRWLQRSAIGLSLLIGGSMWFYAFILADPVPPADQLKDHRWTAAAEARCKVALDDITSAGLRDIKVDVPQDRGRLTQQADDVLRAMVADLRRIEPPADADEARIVGGWLDDWDGYLQDREAWVQQLLQGNGAPMQEEAREGGEPRGKAMQAFADVNDIKSCGIPNGY